ncbi:cytochrome P450 [Aspergillus sclerotioniger CBS 115572]|uniref:Cytochrome P450 n=1 Tax=Aspergillus sclerotioniger CBS 115572 TaxID=1450535 RepID=A0A317WT47_9EURO|nr:cytochrome P450 [Aspergillus sclerotioniger CBS 115572]PWY89509.1 cytochrome P450 [Aspergillus sclerotioniger CBS 115572]
MIGGLPLVYLRDPALIRQLFVKDAESISRCGNQSRGPFGTGKRIIRNALITADGDNARRWHADMLRGFSNRPAMEAFHPKMFSIATRHVQRLRELGSGDNLQEFLQDYAIDVVWSLGLGLENASQHTRDWHESFGQYVQMAASLSYPVHHAMLNLLSGRDFAEPDPREGDLHQRIETCILQLLESNKDILNPDPATTTPNEMSFLQRISYETGGSAAQPITPDVLAHARQIFSHGFPGPTLLLLWALRELSLHSDVEQKLCAELAQSNWHQNQDLKLLSRLAYLDAVVNELARLHPPIPTTARAIDRPIAMQTQCCTSFVLPEKARVAVSLDMLHHDPQIWGEDADRFRPERWEGIRPNKMESEGSYLPFLTGPRRCPCTGFVLQQVKVFLAVLLSETKLEVTNAAMVEKRLGPISEPTKPLSFVISPC